MKVLVTGAAGFIGYHLCEGFLKEGAEVLGIDNLNNYYDVGLKEARLKLLSGHPGFRFEKVSLEDRAAMAALFKSHKFDCVLNLAAQAGVRYSLSNPHAYAESNLVGFLNVLEGCRHSAVGHLVFASSSSVYGLNTSMPFSVHQNVDHPVSLYAATKKSGELMAHSYSHLYGIPCTGLRFFTVYGPWGRPDMAYFLFTRAIEEGQAIDVFNQGKMRRDFTYIDDITEGVLKVAKLIPTPDPAWNSNSPDPASSPAPYRLYNIGNNNPVGLMEFIETLEQCLGKKAIKNMMPMQPGDVEATYADIDSLNKAIGFKPATKIEEGLQKFVKWYKQYYG